MTLYFEGPPSRPRGLMEYIHEHDWFEIGARQSPNGVWWAIFACNLCPDIGSGGQVGPIPAGYCYDCHWANEPGAKKCAECKVKL